MCYLISSSPLLWEVSDALLILPVREACLGKDTYYYCGVCEL